MPECTIISNSHQDQIGSKQATKTFTGTVYMDPVLFADHVTIVNVNFLPGARTFWHNHEGGQILRVLAGSGWVCDKGGEPKRLKVGDICVCPPDTTHWHGADEGSYMLHQAIAHGKTTWQDEVSEEEYRRAKIST
ncbi:hypothetical protein H2198_006097 [Neophaeococcomyces mojaviensis]|uniref:Uncharacterized protein n=1 Tax=Neophaeococcomyces mojaviensis TaxID=3383035 RepID=A0ACC3A492_9EURO|nr:hypothetical protein H2198_006097 [Knufia sp. JES_112]